MHLIKKYVMAEAKTAKQLSQIDVSSEKVRLEPSDADIVVATDSFFGQKPVAQLKQKTLRTDCHNFLAAAVFEILERSPIKYKTELFLDLF